MPSVYDEAGIRFQYPETWELEDADDEEARAQITVSSPDTAFWSLSVYPGLRDVRSLLNEVLQAMQSEYPELEHHQADEQINELPLVGYDINFCYLDLTNTALVRVFHHQDATCLLLCQAEDHELKTAGPVFRAMTQSLLGAGDPES